jgi:hypothetical protein
MLNILFYGGLILFTVLNSRKLFGNLIFKLLEQVVMPVSKLGVLLLEFAAFILRLMIFLAASSMVSL